MEFDISAGLLARLQDYEGSHQNPVNKAMHAVGVPMITIAILGLMAGWTFNEYPSLEIARLDGGVILLGLVLIRYLVLDWKITVPLSFFVVACYFLGRAASGSVLIVMLAIGWVIQFIGHYFFEKKAPAFFRNLDHLLTGPVWFFTKLVGYY